MKYEILKQTNDRLVIVRASAELLCWNCEGLILIGCVCTTYTGTQIFTKYYCKDCETGFGKRYDGSYSTFVKLMSEYKCLGVCEVIHMTWEMN
jgi:hypothetical protein